MRRFLSLCFTVAVLLCAAPSLHAQAYLSLYTFPTCTGTLGNACPQGTLISSLIQAEDGNFYGTTSDGGNQGAGTIFRVSPVGTYQQLYSFCDQTNCADGIAPNSLVLGTDGNLYGTTAESEIVVNDAYVSSFGTVFRYSSTGQFGTLYSFCLSGGTCTDGYGPQGSLIQGVDGKLYGTTQAGGNQYQSGVAYSLTTSGTFTNLHDFCTSQTTDSHGSVTCTDAASPAGGLLQAANGTFYGSSQGLYFSNEYGEYLNKPTSFTMTTAGAVTTSSFCCSGLPLGNLLQTSSGAILGGSTINNDGDYTGNTTNDPSAVYSLAGTDLARANSTTDTSDMFLGTPVLTSNGTLLILEYLTNADSIPYVYLDSITTSGVTTTLGDAFNLGSTGLLVLGGDGHVYSVSNSPAAIAEFAPATALKPPVKLTASATTLKLGQSVTLSWSAANAFSDTMKQCEGYLNGVPQAQTGTSGSYTFKPATAGTYAAGITCGGVESGYLTIHVANSDGSLLPTTTTLSLPSGNIAYGSTFTASAQVAHSAAGYPTGVVNFYSGAALLGTAPLLEGTAYLSLATNTLPVETLPITAKYAGDSADSASTSATGNAVLYAATTTTVTASPSEVASGQPVTLNATAVANNQSSSQGSIAFYYGSLLLGQSTPNAFGVATLTASTTNVPVGIYGVTAVYSGATNYSPSTSAPVYVTVEAQ